MIKRLIVLLMLLTFGLSCFGAGTYTSDHLVGTVDVDTPIIKNTAGASVDFGVENIKTTGTFASSNHIFEGATADDYETTLTVEDPTTPDKTITLPNFTGYAVVDVTKCTDLEGTGLSITNSILNWLAASTDLTDSADLLYEAELDTFSELQAQIADKTLVNQEDAISSIDIDGGTINGITDLAVVDGGTGASSLNNLIALTTHTTGNYAVGDGEAGNALTGDSATAFFSAGTIEHEYGGLEADVSAYSGLVAIASGSTAEIDALSELEGQIADVTAFVVEGTACSDIEGTGLSITTGTLNWSAVADSVTLTTHTVGNYVASITNGAGISGGDGGSEGATLTLAATLGTAIDTSEITDGTLLEADLKAVDAATDEDILTFESTTGDFEWHTIAELLGTASSTDLSDVTAFGGSLIDDPNSKIARETLGLGWTDDPNFAGLNILTGDIVFGTRAKGIRADTRDGSDNYYIYLAGGGAADATRGGYIICSGNEDAGYAGRVDIVAGDAGDIRFYAGGYVGRFESSTLRIDSGNNLAIGTTQWNSGNSIDGEQIAADTIDDDSIDLADITLADFTDDISNTVDTEWDTWIELPALTSAHLLIGNVSNQAVDVAMSGDVAISNAGVTAIQADTIAVAEFLASQDWGDVSTAADGTVSLDNDVVSTAEMANADHGDFTYSGGSATLDTGVVSDNEIDYATVNMDDMTDGSTNAAVTLTQETNWGTAYGWGDHSSLYMLDAGTPADNTLVRFDGTDGMTTQTSGIVVDDSDNVSGMGTLGCGAITSTGLATFGDDVVPDATLTHHLGTSSAYWNRGYIQTIYFDNNAYLSGASGAKITSKGSIVPSVDSANDLGDSTHYFSIGYFDRINLNSTAYLDGSEAGWVKATATRIALYHAVDGAVGPSIQAYRADTGGGAVDSGERLLQIHGMGYDGSVYATGAKIFFNPTENWSNTAHGGKLQFYTVDNTTTGVDLRMTIDHDGAVFMVAAVDDALGNLRDTYWDSTTGQIGYDSSSRKSKTRIRDYEDTVWLYNLRPRIFDRPTGETDQVGLIAEETDLVSGKPSNLVSYKRNITWKETEEIGPDGQVEISREPDRVEITDIPETVNYSRLIVPMLKEIQRLNERVLVLEAKL